MKKIYLMVFYFVLFAHVTNAQNGNSNAILGEWNTPKKDAKILIYKQGEKYYGKISWGNEPGRKDDKNPDPALRNKELAGAILLKDFSFDGKEKWKDGTVYDPNNGKTYSCVLKLKDTKTLEVRGYVGISLFGRTDLFTR